MRVEERIPLVIFEALMPVVTFEPLMFERVFPKMRAEERMPVVMFEALMPVVTFEPLMFESTFPPPMKNGADTIPEDVRLVRVPTDVMAD